MDRVVYFQGAGYSAPLGLPVTNNFLVKSKDLFAENPEQYAHFSEVFDTIKELSIIKNYFNADLFIIEEILSIIDMGQHLEGRKLGDVFRKYIADVIKYYTPEIEPHELGKLPGNWNQGAAVLTSEHLKMIGVICLDSDATVRARYDEFINFQYYRFFNRSTEDYLRFVTRESEGNRSEKPFNKLESSHRHFASSHSLEK